MLEFKQMSGYSVLNESDTNFSSVQPSSGESHTKGFIEKTGIRCMSLRENKEEYKKMYL
jgi:hypothetical protein